MTTLTKQKDFSKTYNGNKKWHNNYFVLFFNDASSSRRVGFCVSKKVGNAVCRNFVKRRLRSLYRETELKIINGDMVLLAKSGIDKVSYDKLKANYINALSKLRLFTA